MTVELSPAAAALLAAVLSAGSAVGVAWLNSRWSVKRQMLELAAAEKRRRAERAELDEQKRRERAEVDARHEGMVMARFDEVLRRQEVHDGRLVVVAERVAALEQRVSELPACQGCGGMNGAHTPIALGVVGAER